MKFRARGTSLIEVLIALTLVAVTMLGLLGLQLRSMGMQKDSLDRRAAAMIVSGFGERVSANYAGYEAGSYFVQPQATWTGCATPANCTTLEIAQRDGYQLQAEAAQRLQSGQAFLLAPTAANANTGVQVTLAWFDVQKRNTDATMDTACADPRVVALAAPPLTIDSRCYTANVYP